MALYEYKCPICASVQERQWPIGLAPDVGDLCEDCNYANTKKVISPPAITFRGTGFYTTDNRINKVKARQRMNFEKMGGKV